MRISIITEGISEFKSLNHLLPQLRARSGNDVSKPLKISVSPDAAPAVVARECKSRVQIALSVQRADLIIVLLDREEQAATSGQIALSLAAEMLRVCVAGANVKVVIKDRAFENWLIADLDALRAQPGRFNVTAAIERKVQPNKADRCDGLSLIKTATRGDGYDKVADSSRIMQKMNVGRAAKHSRSFRHFLHVIGDLEYKGQCRVASTE